VGEHDGKPFFFSLEFRPTVPGRRTDAGAAGGTTRQRGKEFDTGSALLFNHTGFGFRAK
jgi:hypothetical protein